MLAAYASGHAEARDLIGDVLGRLNVGPAALYSTLGRTAARGIETVLLARRMNTWYDAFVNRISRSDTQTFSKDKWEPETWPAKAQELRIPRCSTQRPRPLGADRERQDRTLPVRRAEHLECRPAGPARRNPDPMRPRSPTTTRSSIRNGPSRSSARFTRSIPAWRAACTSWTRPGRLVTEVKVQ